MKKIVLSELIDVLESGSRPKGGVSGESGTIPSLGAEHLDGDGGISFDNPKYISSDFFCSMKRGVVKKDDVLIVKDGATTGKVSFIDERFVFKQAAINEHVFRLAVNSQKALPKYIYYYLSGDIGTAQVLSDFRGATVGGISQGFLDKVIVPLSEISDQRRTVKILDKANDIRQIRKQSLQLLDDFLRAMFFEMFVSKEWGVGKLGEEIDVKSGQVDPKESIYTGMICVGGDNIEANTGRLLGLKTAKEVGAKSGKYLFDEGDILYSKIRPYLNKVVLTDFKGICSADIYPLKPKRKLTREFLTFILRSKDFLQYADKHSSRTSIPKINREALAEYEIILPPIDMQEQFSITFQQVERLKALLVKSASELDNQFNALMQKYFS